MSAPCSHGGLGKNSNYQPYTEDDNMGKKKKAYFLRVGGKKNGPRAFIRGPDLCSVGGVGGAGVALLRAEPFCAKARWEAAGRASSLSHASPRLHSGPFTDPHYFPSPWLVKSNLAPRYQQNKTALSSAAPLGGPCAFQLSSLPLRAGSRLSGQVPVPISSLFFFFFAKGPGILISRAVNYLHGHPVPSWPPCSCPCLRPVW